MDISIGEWGLEVNFFRTRVGAEFELLPRLESWIKQDSTHFYASYGYFDLVALRTIRALSDPNFIPLDSAILEMAPFRFFPPREGRPQDELLASLGSWPAAIITFLKIHPCASESDSLTARWYIASRLTKCFQDAHIMFGMGYSELLLVAGGDDLELLLRTVTECRTPAGHAALADLQGELRIGRKDSLFQKTTTFPLISYNNVHMDRRYDRLKGYLHPIVTVSCDSACESCIFSFLNTKYPKVKVRTVYGKTDLILYWDGEVLVSEFARFLTDLRTLTTTTGLLAKTTSYMEIERDKSKPVDVTGNLSQKHPKPVASRVPMESIVQVQPPALRASLTDLMLRLLACTGEGDETGAYRDMENTIEYVMDTVNNGLLSTTVTGHKKMQARFVLARIADLARAAIHQRYAGIESHPETLAHSQSVLTSDIGTIVHATSCAPYYIFSRLRPGFRVDQLWSGFVMFGTSYSPHWHVQDILALPADSISSPVFEWWKITHETAHAVFRVLNVRTMLAEYSNDLYNAVVSDIAASSLSPDHMLQELFANWFDWRYVFAGETELFQKAIWSSWLGYPLIWQNPRAYICRSFAVFLCGDVEQWSTAAKQGRRDKSLLPYLEKQWQAYLGLMDNDVRWQEYRANVVLKVKQDIFSYIEYLLPLMRFFMLRLEDRCEISGFFRRLNPDYPDIEKDIISLTQGHVIERSITNPCRLSLELLRRHETMSVPLATEVAYILSLANTYRLMSKTEE